MLEASQKAAGNLECRKVPDVKHLRQAVRMLLARCGDGEMRLCAIPLQSAHKKTGIK
jgi:hypothetical protein